LCEEFFIRADVLEVIFQPDGQIGVRRLYGGTATFR
jgi:hypothetical protein